MSTPFWNQIIAGMLSELAPIVIPTGGVGKTDAQYVYFADTYAGMFQIDDAFEQPQLGSTRTPFVLIQFAGEKPIAETVGRRKEKVEATFVAICVTDSVKSRSDRGKQLLQLTWDVGQLLSSHQLGLDMLPLFNAGVVVVRDDPRALAYGVKFTTRYHRDYTKAAPTQMLATASGSFVVPGTGNPDADPPVPPTTIGPGLLKTGLDS